jgi:hypothetical protein
VTQNPAPWPLANIVTIQNSLLDFAGGVVSTELNLEAVTIHCPGYEGAASTLSIYEHLLTGDATHPSG